MGHTGSDSLVHPRQGGIERRKHTRIAELLLLERQIPLRNAEFEFIDFQGGLHNLLLVLIVQLQLLKLESRHFIVQFPLPHHVLGAGPNAVEIMLVGHQHLHPLQAHIIHGHLFLQLADFAGGFRAELLQLIFLDFHGIHLRLQADVGRRQVQSENRITFVYLFT